MSFFPPNSHIIHENYHPFDKGFKEIVMEDIKEARPVKAKPHFYSVCLLPMQEIAMGYGYNLLVHGSMNRDLDLIAVAWVNEPRDEKDLVKALDRYLKGVQAADGHEESIYLFTVLPGGRHSYVIDLNRGGRFNHYVDEQYYLDISFTPQIKQ